MKRFECVPPPRGWATHGLAAGRKWLRDHRDAERPRDLWSPFRLHLREGFRQLCGYSAMWISEGTVDHFIPWVQVRGTRKAHLAYQWKNFRYSAGWFNAARKQTAVPDPHEIQDDWFELLLPSLEMVATDRVPAEARSLVDNALRWLRDDPRVVEQRGEWWRMYRDGELNLVGLEKKAPLLVAALRRQPEYLRPEDRAPV